MSYTSSSTNSAAHSRVRPTNSRSHPPRRAKNKARLSSCAPASSASHTLAHAQLEERQWKTFQDMYLVSRRKFVRMAYNILRNQEDAEDAVQDALLSAYIHLRAFEGRSAVSTWFGRIVINAALLIRRKRKPSQVDLHTQSTTTEEASSWTERIPSPEPDPEMIFAQQETFQHVDVLLNKMNPMLRQAFTMTYFDELSSKQAVAQLGVTKENFKSRLFRARRHLMHRAKRSLVAPMRRVAHSPLFASSNEFDALAARPAKTASQEIAFS
jgi:RNA polymerase sigma-70 factor (ECF subfamily)